MANKDHTLDNPIITASLNEFLQNGYEKTSLRKIAANANVTVGAIYTRYSTKDQLFCSLVEPLLHKIEEVFRSLKIEFSKEQNHSYTDSFAQLLKKENDVILRLLFENYDQSVLLLCKSNGSSLENFFDLVIERKIKETIHFFQYSNIKHPDNTILKILITGQFHMYDQIIRGGYSLEDSKRIMNTAMQYHLGGWISLFNMYS